MKLKQHSLQVGTFTLNYQYSLQYRSWVFNTPNLDLLVPCKGQETAHKVANAIAGAIKRHGKIDNLARAAILKITLPT